MTTLKIGTKGEEVKKLQQALGILADGIFGVKTEDAVKAFQKSNNLKVDGIVGPMTWALLLKDKCDINITKGYINTHITRLANRPVKYIAVHYTAGGSSKTGSALNTRNVFLQRKASADFVVDDGSIVQINPDLNNYFCWSVGDDKNSLTGGGRLYGIATNRNTISIEICSNLKKGSSPEYANHQGWYYTDASLNNAIKLIRYLMKRFNVPKTNVVRHYDVSGKMCPGIIGWNDAYIYNEDGKQTKDKNNSRKWMEFWNKI